MNEATKTLRAVIVSDVYGQRGGAYRVASLLHRTLNALGITTKCFVTSYERSSAEGFAEADIIRPWIARGSRWDIPNRLLAFQAQQYIEQQKPNAVFVIGLTKLCTYLLKRSQSDNIFVWELTNANPGNKFVDRNALPLLNRTRALLSPSQTIDRAIRDNYLYQGRIERLPFWIEEEDSDYRISPTSFASDFLFLARREEEKGLREFIHATSQLAKLAPELRVAVGGPGDDGPYLELAKTLGIRRNITFLNLPTRNEAMNALRNSRYLVLPSYHEGYPISLLEAAAKSVPFIATDVGSVRELFQNCLGIMIPQPKDIDQLFQAMLTVHNFNPAEYEKARLAVWTRYQELYTDNRIQKTLLDLMHSTKY